MANHAAEHAGTTAGARKCTWSWRSISCDGWDARHIRRFVYLNGDERPNEERGKIEKDRKIRQQLQATEEKALALLEQGKPINFLSVADLDVLLVWHQAPKMKGAKKVGKLQQWMAIREDGEPPPAYDRWTDEDEQRLAALDTTNIDISDTQYGRQVSLKKRELEAAADHFNGRRETSCERNGMQWMWRMRRKP